MGETQFVGPVVSGVPLPPSGKGDGTLRARLLELGAGQMFETRYSKEAARQMAKKLGIRVETRKLRGGTIGVWRVA